MCTQSIAMAMFLDAFKSAAAEGAVVELKMRLLAGSDPALQKYALDRVLRNVEAAIAKHFGDALSDNEKETLRLCRELRNKVLHTDFQAARDKLNELGIETQSGGVRKIDIPVVSKAEILKKSEAAKAGIEGTFIADTPSTDLGTVYGWFIEAGRAGDFEKASNAFKDAATIIDRLANM
jgi:hypothetical protein